MILELEFNLYVALILFLWLQVILIPYRFSMQLVFPPVYMYTMYVYVYVSYVYGYP